MKLLSIKICGLAFAFLISFSLVSNAAQKVPISFDDYHGYTATNMWWPPWMMLLNSAATQRLSPGLELLRPLSREQHVRNFFQSRLLVLLEIWLWIVVPWLLMVAWMAPVFLPKTLASALSATGFLVLTSSIWCWVLYLWWPKRRGGWLLSWFATLLPSLLILFFSWKLFGLMTIPGALQSFATFLLLACILLWGAYHKWCSADLDCEG